MPKANFEGIIIIMISVIYHTNHHSLSVDKLKIAVLDNIIKQSSILNKQLTVACFFICHAVKINIKNTFLTSMYGGKNFLLIL